MHETSSTPATREPSAEEVGLALSTLLQVPLSALRASMETIEQSFREDPRHRTLAAALDRISGLSRDVDALVRLAAPAPLTPTRCRLDEILETARRRIDRPERVVIPRAQSGHARCDALALGRGLEELLLTALDSGAPEEIALLQARHSGEVTSFTIVHASRGAGSGPGTGRSDALGRRLAEGVVHRMGGMIAEERTERGARVVRVLMPRLTKEAV